MEGGKGVILMQQYELGRMLGQGTFAKVYYARNVKDGQSVAIKVIDKDKISRAGMVDQIKREISVMRLVRHPNIIHLHEVMATKTKIYFVIEYARGGELFDKVVKGRLKDESAWRYFQQLIDAVDFCHSRGVYHRDLKPENLLLDDNGVLKVSDFGLSALADSKRQDGMLHTMCGTPAYVAPEVIGRKGYDGVKADIWSCGVILYVLLAGYLPFHDSNLMEMYRKIGKAEFRCPNWFAPEVRKLLVRMMDPNPNMRVSIAKIKENPWFKRGWFKERRAKANGVNITNGGGGAEAVGEEGAGCVQLNAFDVISLSGGFNLSGLFEDGGGRREVRFTSRKAASVIISKLEELGRRMKMKTGKKDRGLLKMEALEEGRKGKVGIEMEIFEVAEMVYLVEVKKSNGDTLEYEKLLKEDIRPGLQDIVWVWQGENQQQKLEEEEDKKKQERESHKEKPDKEEETTTTEIEEIHGNGSDPAALTVV